MNFLISSKSHIFSGLYSGYDHVHRTTERLCFDTCLSVHRGYPHQVQFGGYPSQAHPGGGTADRSSQPARRGYPGQVWWGYPRWDSPSLQVRSDRMVPRWGPPSRDGIPRTQMQQVGYLRWGIHQPVLMGVPEVRYSLGRDGVPLYRTTDGVLNTPWSVCSCVHAAGLSCWKLYLFQAALLSIPYWLIMTQLDMNQQLYLTW